MVAYSQISDVPLFKYGLIMADPPWHHDRWSDRGSDRAPSEHYDTMALEEVKGLRVGDLCGPDSLIMLWVPGCFINIGEAILNAWGAEFVTMGFWVKTQLHDPSKPKMGTGYVLRECGEPFLIGKIGKPQVIDKGVPSVIMGPRREHSRKPEAGYALAERLAPKGYAKLDLFSRQEREGWDCMGDEHDKFTDTNGRCGQADWQERKGAEKDGGRRTPKRTKDTIGATQIYSPRIEGNQSGFIFG